MLTAELTIERFNRKRKLVEVRTQPSRSFVRGFLGMLYVAHAHLSKTEPYAQNDILGNSRQMDVDERGVPLLVAAPGGWTNFMNATDYDELTHIAADLIGIQVGEGTTPPTPTDYALEGRIPHTEHIPEVVDSRGEYYLQQVTPGEYEIYGSRWYATEFTCLWPHQLHRVRLRMYREGLPGTVTVGIRTDRSGADLVTATIDGDALTEDPAGEWRDFDFGTHPQLNFLGKYNIVIRATGGDASNSIHLIMDQDEVYGGGNGYYSSSSGGSWSSHSGSGYAWITLFEEFGRNLERGILYSGCEVYGLSFSHPNGQFSIRRYFQNASGSSWTVNEVGIYAMGTHSSSECWSFMIARDLVSPGIAVPDGQLLRVTYVPQITV